MNMKLVEWTYERIDDLARHANNKKIAENQRAMCSLTPI